MRQWIWAYITRAGASPLITEYQRAKSVMGRGEEVKETVDNKQGE